jgi:hypothetical protein
MLVGDPKNILVSLKLVQNTYWTKSIEFGILDSI